MEAVYKVTEAGLAHMTDTSVTSVLMAAILTDDSD